MEKVTERSCLYANTTWRHGVHIVPRKQIEENLQIKQLKVHEHIANII